MIEGFDSKNLADIVGDINHVLGHIAGKYGISIMLKRCKFDETNASLELEMRIKDATGQPISRERADFIRYAEDYGFQPTDIDKAFIHNGYRFVIAGLKTANHRYPVLARNVVDGRMFKLSVELVQHCLLMHPVVLQDPEPTNPVSLQLMLPGSTDESE